MSSLQNIKQRTIIVLPGTTLKKKAAKDEKLAVKNSVLPKSGNIRVGHKVVECMTKGTWVQRRDHPSGISKMALNSVLETRCKHKEKPGWYQSKYGYAVRRSSVSKGCNQPLEIEIESWRSYSCFIVQGSTLCSPTYSSCQLQVLRSRHHLQ